MKTNFLRGNVYLFIDFLTLAELVSQVFGNIVPAVVAVRGERRVGLPGHAVLREVWGKGSFASTTYHNHPSFASNVYFLRLSSNVELRPWFVPSTTTFTSHCRVGLCCSFHGPISHAFFSFVWLHARVRADATAAILHVRIRLHQRHGVLDRVP